MPWACGGCIFNSVPVLTQGRLFRFQFRQMERELLEMGYSFLVDISPILFLIIIRFTSSFMFCGRRGVCMPGAQAELAALLWVIRNLGRGGDIVH